MVDPKQDRLRESEERKGCPACGEQRLHTEEEWKNHPFHKHGYTGEQGWTHPDLGKPKR